MQLSKSTILVAATIAPLVLLGVIAVKLPSTTKPSAVDFKSTGVTETVDPAPAGTSAPAQDSSSTPTGAAGAETLGAPGASTLAASTDDSQAPENVPADTPAPVTAISATLSAWSDPQAGPVEGSTVQNEYCVYSYSDGTTQERLYQSKTNFNGVVAAADPSFDCTTATAP